MENMGVGLAANQIGLEESIFAEALKNNAAAKKISSDQNDGVSLGVNSTPTFFINGKKYVGQNSYDELSKAIAEARQ